MSRINLLKDEKIFRKLCKKLDGEFKCREAFGCLLSCPLALAKEVEMLMNSKQTTVGEALAITLREGIPNVVARDILADAVRNRIKPYPDKDWISLINSDFIAVRGKKLRGILLLDNELVRRNTFTNTSIMINTELDEMCEELKKKAFEFKEKPGERV